MIGDRDHVLVSVLYSSPVRVNSAPADCRCNSPPNTHTLPFCRTCDAKYKRGMLIGARFDHVPFTYPPVASGVRRIQLLPGSYPCTMTVPSVRSSIVPVKSGA